MTITPSLVVHNQAICVSSSSVGFDGILGYVEFKIHIWFQYDNITISLGPTDLTLGALSPDTTSTVPTIVDNAFSQGLISADEISIAFEPTTSANSLNGVLTWGISFSLISSLVTS